MNWKIVLLMLCMVSSPNFFFGAGSSDADIILDATNGWKKIEEATKNYTFLFETVRNDGIAHNPAKGDYAVSKIEASFKGNNVLFRKYFDNGDGTGTQFFACRNDDYVFRVVRSGQNEPWRLNDLDVPEHIDHDVPFDTDEMETISSPWSILYIPLRVIVNDPSFHLIEVSREQDADNTELVSVSFELQSVNSAYELMTQLRQCKVLLDPKHDYAVISFEAEFENRGGKSRFKGIGKCSYNFDSGFPALKSYHYTLQRDGGTQKEITWKTTFSKIGPCTLDSKEFRLSAYGFSEPDNPQRRTNIIRIVLMTAGVLLILFGLYLRWFATKKK